MIRPSRRGFLAFGFGSPAFSGRSSSGAEEMKRRHLLAGALPAEKLAGLIMPRTQWRPFPTASERSAWNHLPEAVRKEAIAAAERHLGATWEVLPATLFLEFKRTGNRSHYEGVYNARRGRLRELVIAECVEGKGRFLDPIANGIWLICEETYWGYPAHVGVQKAGVGLPDVTEPTVDLFAAETSALLAWTDYLLGPLLNGVSPLLRKRIAWEINRRILTPNLERDDFGWMGLGPNLNRPMNNWNPWINSNWLTSVLLVEPDEKRRIAAIRKILLSLDRFLDSYADDGGCDEGPGYWGRAGASLFDCLELLYSASGGKIQFYSHPLVGEIGRYIVRAHIAGDWYTNFADASARNAIPGDLVFRYGARIGDENMRLLGAWAVKHASSARRSSESLGRLLPALFDWQEIEGAPARQPLIRDAWMPGIQVMTARMRAGSTDGLYLAAQGGHNAESHNHNDVGNFIVFADGEPAIIDVGVETYSAKTFSRHRYEIWTMQSAFHNLPTIDGVMQGAGREFAARNVACRLSEELAELRMDIARAYPAEAGLKQWLRVFRLDRTKRFIEIADEYAMEKPARQVTLTLMTPCHVSTATPGAVTLTHSGFRQGAVRVRFEPATLKPVIEPVHITDSRLKAVWGDLIYRVLLTAERPPQTGGFRLRIAQEGA